MECTYKSGVGHEHPGGEILCIEQRHSAVHIPVDQVHFCGYK